MPRSLSHVTCLGIKPSGARMSNPADDKIHVPRASAYHNNLLSRRGLLQSTVLFIWLMAHQAYFRRI